VGGFPPNPVPRAGFSARWQGNFNFEGGNFEFVAAFAGGMRVYIDGQLVINRWYDQSLSTYAAARTLTAGNHVIKVEFYSQGSQPSARLSWQKMSF
jgi:single-stranded DNA-binding protein